MLPTIDYFTVPPLSKNVFIVLQLSNGNLKSTKPDIDRSSKEKEDEENSQAASASTFLIELQDFSSFDLRSYLETLGETSPHKFCL